ncbi:MAG: lysophospholipid acyltransferase family protein [Pseudomonadota bacterium]
MMLLRSILFILFFYAATLVQMIFWTPVFFFLKREDGWKVVKIWGWLNLWVHHLLLGTRFDFRGLEHIPADKGAIIAAKHQSTWETYAMLLFINDPSYILKRELIFIPLFGWFAAKMRMIPVNRGKRSEALRAMNREAQRQYNNGRHIIIYPEGTRKMAHAEPAYKYGITHMYESINANVIPMALNSGLFWPRNSKRLYKGTIVLEFLPPIKSGLDPKDFTHKMIDAIEGKTAELLKEGETDPAYDGPRRLESN